jgi:hypothetical protein
MKIYREERMNGVNPTLVEAVKKLNLTFDILIVDGLRTVAEQEALFKAGKSKGRGKNAPHCKGNALDICPVDSDGKPLWTDTAKFDLLRKELGAIVALKPKIAWDANHFELRVK